MEHSIKEQLFALAEAEYRRFSAALIPNMNIHHMLGVRLPELRKLAKRIAKGDWRSYLQQADDEFFEEIMLQRLDGIRHDGYYVNMAVAWAVSICFVKHPGVTMAYLTSCSLDDFTYNKALQKITESLRVSPETKKTIRGMKR
ncbi:hypothetical protein [Paenibacillus sp. y28]|uniref:hypothetical protein n=1 Tax=Paenibacillus sp. y28 TaxID=3129110 RepID=UPI003015DA28